MIAIEVQLCGCGCGEPVTPGRRFRQGHYARTEEWKERFRETVRESPTFGQGGRKTGSTPFGKALREALAKAGKTLVDVAREAGIGDSTPYGWTAGHAPYREGLRRVADILDAPELLSYFPPRWRRIQVKCLTCGVITPLEPAYVRTWVKRGLHPGHAIDWEKGTGVYEHCLRCAAAIVAKASPAGRKIQRVRKRKGRKGLQQIGRDLQAKHTPEQRVEYTRKALAALKAKDWTPEARGRYSALRIRLPLKGRFGICRICGALTYLAQPRPPRKRGDTHAPCLQAYRRAHQKEIGKPVYPRGRRGRHLSPKHLAISFELAVRALLKGEPITGTDSLTSEMEARGLLYAESSIFRRIKDFIALLDVPEGTGARLTFWAKALTEAWNEREQV